MALTFGLDMSGRYEVAATYMASYGVQQPQGQIRQLVTQGRLLLSTGLLLYPQSILINLGLPISDILLLLAIKNSLIPVSFLLPALIDFNGTAIAPNLTV
jgi:hypothetical protein